MIRLGQAESSSIFLGRHVKAPTAFTVDLILGLGLCHSLRKLRDPPLAWTRVGNVPKGCALAGGAVGLYWRHLHTRGAFLASPMKLSRFHQLRERTLPGPSSRPPWCTRLKLCRRTHQANRMAVFPGCSVLTGLLSGRFLIDSHPLFLPPGFVPAKRCWSSGERGGAPENRPCRMGQVPPHQLHSPHISCPEQTQRKASETIPSSSIKQICHSSFHPRY